MPASWSSTSPRCASTQTDRRRPPNWSPTGCEEHAIRLKIDAAAAPASLPRRRDARPPDPLQSPQQRRELRAGGSTDHAGLPAAAETASNSPCTTTARACRRKCSTRCSAASSRASMAAAGAAPGLGLSIVKSFVELHGGTVRIETGTGQRHDRHLPVSRSCRPACAPRRNRRAPMADRAAGALARRRGATARLGEDLALALRPGDVLALSGDLGAGKTTLARGADPRHGRRSGARRAEPDLHAGADLRRPRAGQPFRSLPAVVAPPNSTNSASTRRWRTASRWSNGRSGPATACRPTRSRSSSRMTAKAGWRRSSASGAGLRAHRALARHPRLPRRRRLGRRAAAAISPAMPRRAPTRRSTLAGEPPRVLMNCAARWCSGRRCATASPMPRSPTPPQLGRRLRRHRPGACARRASRCRRSIAPDLDAGLPAARASRRRTAFLDADGQPIAERYAAAAELLADAPRHAHGRRASTVGARRRPRRPALRPRRAC